jgi:hypothetical protein
MISRKQWPIQAIAGKIWLKFLNLNVSADAVQYELDFTRLEQPGWNHSWM